MDIVEKCAAEWTMAAFTGLAIISMCQFVPIQAE